MKATPIMFLEYLGMLGVPALLVLLVIFVLVGVGGVARTVLLLVTAADCLVYGAVSLRSTYLHGSGSTEARQARGGTGRGSRAAHTR